ncbi:hypothetical protein M378DRAFT_56315, partial [Amanita muscaria Koide BX008]
HSPPECHPNTRKTIRDQIGKWLDESVSKQSSLLWLNGPTGVGKSVIAKTVSGFYDQIVATFYFSTSSDKTTATLFPTLAWQLARRIPDTRKHIIASLKRNDSLQTSQIEDQFDLLIIQPLKSTTTLKYRPVMVIDGVDECTNEEMLGRFLRVLVKAGEGGDMPVRFIIFTTHSFPTSDRLNTLCSYPVISRIRIGFSQECKDDMTRYLTDNFNAKNQPGDDPSPWFLPSDISNLVEASCGQFLYASTIVGLLDDP